MFGMNAKKVVLVLLVLFLGFWMFQDPHGFAVSARELFSGSWDALTVVFRGLIRFLGELS
ncbi:hypothetical protein GCM10009844_41150 [Nocardioides koreensis]|uniref:Uncharacterized protein n=2 Tax=Nocardioides koreensis TaxID=433651 RepID=A0ABP5LZS8_9ACTN